MDDEQPLGEHPELPPHLFQTQRAILTTRRQRIDHLLKLLQPQEDQ